MWFVLFIIALVCAAGLHLIWRRRWIRSQSRVDVLERELAQARVQFERSLAESSAQLRAVFDSMVEGVLVLSEDRRIQLANSALVEILGLPDNIVERSLIEVLRRHELDELTRDWRENEEPREIEFEVGGPAFRVLQVTASAFRGTDRQMQGMILVFHDLTRIKQLENVRQEFVANVSHELRTPLSVIRGYVETLLTLPEERAELRTKFLTKIDKHTRRLGLLIDDLLTLSRLESGACNMELRRVEVRGIGDAVMDDFRTNAREREMSMHNEIPESLLVEADPERLRQVLCNLVDNAVKYGRQAGQIRLGGRLSSDGAMVEMWVNDDGPGIPFEAQARVFERFYRVDSARSSEKGGTGLGLSIVKHIVQLHGGRVWVESRPGEGSTFYFALPVSRPESMKRSA